jgi:glycosyltransferase 2 family protein
LANLLRKGGPIVKQDRRLLAAAIVLALIVLLLFALHSRRDGFDWSLFSSTLVRMRWPWLLVAAFLSLATYYGRALRWAVMIRGLNRQPNVWRLFSATAVGFTAIILFGRAGELVRPYLISVKEKVSFSSQLAAWVIERICDLLAALLIIGSALALVGRSGAKVGPALQWTLRAGGYLAAFVGVTSVLLFVALSRSSGGAAPRVLGALGFLPERWRTRIGDFLTSFSSGAQCTRSLSGVLSLAAYTALEWVLIILCYVASFQAFPALAGLGLTDVLILLGFAVFGSLVQIPGIGGGVQVATILVLTEIFRIPLEVATGISLVCYAITVIVIVPIGVPLLVRDGINWRKLKEMEGETLL